MSQQSGFDRRLLPLALGGFVGTNEGFLISSLLPAVSQDTGVSVGEASLLVSAYSFAYATATPILSALLGRFDRRTVLVRAELTFALFALLIASAQSFGWLLAARTGLAIGAGMFTATAFGTAVAMSAPERRGRALGTVAAGQSLALVIGVPTSALLAAAYGWHVIYSAAGALALLAAAAMWLWLPPSLSGDQRSLRERVSVLGIRGVPPALLTTMIFMIACYIPLIFIAPIAEHATGLTQSSLPVVLLAYGLGAFSGSNLGGRLTDRLGGRRVVIAMAEGQVLLLLALYATPRLPDAATFPSFLVLMALAAFIGWGFWAAQSTVVTGFAPASAPLLMALHLTALNIGVTLSAGIGGRVLDYVGVDILPMSVLPVAVIALFLVCLPASRKRNEPE